LAKYAPSDSDHQTNLSVLSFHIVKEFEIPHTPHSLILSFCYLLLMIIVTFNCVNITFFHFLDCKIRMIHMLGNLYKGFVKNISSTSDYQPCWLVLSLLVVKAIKYPIWQQLSFSLSRHVILTVIVIFDRAKVTFIYFLESKYCWVVCSTFFGRKETFRFRQLCKLFRI